MSLNLYLIFNLFIPKFIFGRNPHMLRYACTVLSAGWTNMFTYLFLLPVQSKLYMQPEHTRSGGRIQAKVRRQTGPAGQNVCGYLKED